MSLQWGHAVLCVETERPQGIQYALQSFNGATLFCAWKLVVKDKDEREKDLLQWGHAVLCVETKIIKEVITSIDGLQWGHAVLCVETPKST